MRDWMRRRREALYLHAAIPWGSLAARECEHTTALLNGVVFKARMLLLEVCNRDAH